MNRNTARFLALAAALFACASAAKAAVVISAGKTRHMNCSAGVCTPTAKKATLNTGDLANMLAGGDMKIATGNGAVSITVIGFVLLDGREPLDFRRTAECELPRAGDGGGSGRGDDHHR